EPSRELTPIARFIRRGGAGTLPLRLHLATMILGGLSFLVRLCWRVATRLSSAQRQPDAAGPRGRATEKAKVSRSRKKAQAKAEPAREETWHLSLFRLLLFAAFSALSFRATRNSHQFAA